MASDLYWYPKTPPEGNPLPRQLKYVIARQYFGHDGSLSGQATLTTSDMDFLRGIVAAAGVDEVREGAQALINAIERHGTVILELRW